MSLDVRIALAFALLTPLTLLSAEHGRRRGEPGASAQVPPAVVRAASGALSGNPARFEPMDFVAPMACEFAVLPSCGTTFQATLGLGDCLAGDFYVDFYRLSGAAGDQVRVTVSSPGRVIILTLQRSDTGAVVASKNGTSPVTLGTQLPFSGEFAIGVGYLQPFSSGSYTISRECESNTECVVRGTLSCGGTWSESLSSSDCQSGGDFFADVYEFAGVAGQPVEVTVSASFVPYVEIRDAEVTSGSWVQGNNPDTLVFVPAMSGTHRVIVSTYEQNTTGSYSVTMSCPPSDCRRRPVRRP